MPRDVLLLIAGALLALSVDELRDARHRRARARESLISIRNEIRANLMAVAEAREHHAFLVDTLEKLAATRRLPDRPLYVGGIFNPAYVTDVAWSLARESGAIADVPLPMVLTIAGAYDRQAGYRLLSDDMATSILDQVRRDGIDATLRDHFTQFIALDTDFMNREGGLLRRYTLALIQLDRRINE